MSDHVKMLAAMGVCSEAAQWSDLYSTMQVAWDACDRGDWMLCLLGMVCGGPRSQSRRMLTLAACACARLALPHVAEGDTRPLKAIETAERWARRDPGMTRATVRAAAACAGDSAYDADAVDNAYDESEPVLGLGDATNAAYAASAYAAYDAARTAYVDDVADAAEAAAAYAAASAFVLAGVNRIAARHDARRRCAEVVREMIPKAPRLRRAK